MKADTWTMVNRHERVDVFSPAEYRRRIGAMRALMRKKEIDLAVFLDGSEEVYGQWLCGVRFLEYVIVPAEGEVIGVLWNELNENGCFPSETVDYDRYITQKPAFAPCEGIRFINRASDSEIMRVIAGFAPHKLGFIRPERMTAAFADALTEQLPKAVTEDISVPVAVLRAHKSEEELAAIKVSRDTQVKVFNALPYMIRPGRTAREITHEMRYMLTSMGASGCMCCQLVNSGPSDDTLSESYGLHDRKIQKGDRMFAILEANGAGQQHVAFGRHIMYGEPTPFAMKAISDEIKAHKYAASLMRADGQTTLAQIAVKTRKYINSLGYHLYESVGWNWMHSMGSFMYEQLSLEDYTENVPLEEGIVLHCHPKMYSYYTDERNRFIRREVFILNTYRITKGDPIDLIGVPFEPVILD